MCEGVERSVSLVAALLIRLDLVSRILFAGSLSRSYLLFSGSKSAQIGYFWASRIKILALVQHHFNI
jgi:hypothetical protein